MKKQSNRVTYWLKFEKGLMIIIGDNDIDNYVDDYIHIMLIVITLINEKFFN